MKNVTISYSNSPSCEFIGSKIYEILGIPVHETFIGTYKGKTVVACKDFLSNGDRLYEFRELKTTFSPPFLDENGELTDGNGTKLSEALIVLRNHEAYVNLKDSEEYFWKMFIVDALIGNADRNNGNHGIIARLDGKRELAPIYDNGGCLNNKWDDNKIQEYLGNKEKLETQAYKGIYCSFLKDNEKKINPFQYLTKTNEPKCLKVSYYLLPLIKKNEKNIMHLIDSVPTISDLHKIFIKNMISIRVQAFASIWKNLNVKLNERNEKNGLLCEREHTYSE